MRVYSVILLLLSATILFAGCAERTCPTPIAWQANEVADIVEIPQNPAFFAATLQRGPIIPPASQDRLAQEFTQRFFAPWDQETSPLAPSDAFWGVASYGTRQNYGENMLARPQSWMDELIARMARDRFPSLALPAIALRSTSMRVMPTDKPFFLDFRQAGEGFPFDYFQNSMLWAGAPLFISHVSTDRAWYFVEAAFASGWVRVEDVALVDRNFMATYRNGSYAAVIDDEVEVIDLGGRYRCTAHVGTVFPLVSRESSSLLVLVPVGDGNGHARLEQAMLRPNQAAPLPLDLTPESAGRVAAVLAGQLYGWGGLYENRDCSAMLKDFFTPFGIWLPRNSTGQGNTGRTIDLEGLSREEKQRVIREQGIPFASLLWMRGHIMLYLGQYEGEAVAFHNIWGLRTLDVDEDGEGRSGRNIIGRAVVTTLLPGQEIQNLDPAKGHLLDRINTLAIMDE